MGNPNTKSPQGFFFNLTSLVMLFSTIFVFAAGVATYVGATEFASGVLTEIVGRIALLLVPLLVATVWERYRQVSRGER